MSRVMDPRELLKLKKRMGLGPTAARSGAGGMSMVAGLEAALAAKANLAGDSTFAGTVTAEQVHANTGFSTDGTVTIEEGTLRATNLTSTRDIELPDASGNLLVDAPSDGKYYVRKDGAWVEIIP